MGGIPATSAIPMLSGIAIATTRTPATRSRANHARR